MKKRFFLLGIILFLTSCVHNSEPVSVQQNGVTLGPFATFTQIITQSPSATPSENSSECLLPIKEFEYQLGGEPPVDELPEPEKVLPLKGWQKIENVPKASSLRLIQTINNKTIFWIRKSSGGFIKFQFINNDWKNGVLIDGPAAGNYYLFIDRENNVWSTRVFRLNKNEELPEALINRYNEKTNQWEPITLELDNQDNLGIRNVEVDEQGTIWFLITDEINYSLYSLNPKTMMMEQHLQDYVLHPPFIISNNTIYIFANSIREDVAPGYSLLKYAIDSREITFYYIPAEFYCYSFIPDSTGCLPDTLFVDNNQRVWLGARGWLDLSKSETYDWHVIVKNPVFVDVFPGAGKWVWGEPRILFQSSDGLIWFSSLRGPGWVDPVEGKWCVVTSYESNVLADSYGNIWLLAGNWLYIRK
jgi:hypothetical protein